MCCCTHRSRQRLRGARRGPGVPPQLGRGRRLAPLGSVGARGARLRGTESSAPGWGGSAPGEPGSSSKGSGLLWEVEQSCLAVPSDGHTRPHSRTWSVDSHAGPLQTLVCSGQVTFTPVTEQGLASGNSQRERNQQVELEHAPWVWIGSSSLGTLGFPIRSRKVRRAGGLQPSPSGCSLSRQGAGSGRGSRALEPALGEAARALLREQAQLFTGRQKPNCPGKPQSCAGSSLGAARACDSCAHAEDFQKGKAKPGIT